MAVLAEIESRIMDLEAGNFHELCDALASSMGYSNRTSIGRVTGKPVSKRGTPDTAFRNDGSWAFVECTTQKSRIEEKVTEDIDKCLNESKTGISTCDVDAILYFSSNQTLEEKSYRNFEKKLKAYQIAFDFYGPSRIADKVYHLYPHLAADFLNIEVGPKEIGDLRGFLAHYKSRSNGIPIDNPFCLRDEETARLYDMLSSKRVVSITGDPGVGKTKLACYVIDRFSNDNNLPVICIRSTAIITIAEIERALSIHANAVVLIDDVNKLNDLVGLMELVISYEDVRMVMTVRNYAVPALKEAELHTLSAHMIEHEIGTINLTAFSDEEIKEIAETSFGISDALSLQAICKACKGNSRLVAMACSLIQDNGSLGEAFDASTLYESYFGAIESSTFSDKRLLTALSLVALFSPVELSFFENAGASLISETCLSNPEFTDCLAELNALEMIDMEQGKAAAIPNQSLTVYVLKRAFFDGEVIPLETVLVSCYPLAPRRIISMLKDVCSVFCKQSIYTTVNNAAIAAWGVFESDEHECFPSYRRSFCALNPTQALSYVRKSIQSMEYEGTRSAEEPASADSDDCLEILKQLNGCEYAGLAIDMLIAYYEKRPSEIDSVLDIIIGRFCIVLEESTMRFPYAIPAIKSLYALASEKQGVHLTLFVEAIKRLLKVDYENAMMISPNQIVFAEGALPLSPSVTEWRTLCWTSLSDIRDEVNHEAIDAAVLHYAKQGRSLHDGAIEIVSFDLPFAEQYADDYLDPSSVQDAILLFKLEEHFTRYLQLTPCSPILTWRHSPYENELIILNGRTVYDLEDRGFEYETKRIQQILDYAETATIESVDRICVVCASLEKNRERVEGPHRANATSVILACNKLNREDLVEAFCQQIVSGRLVLGSHSNRLVELYAGALGVNRAFQSVSASSFKERAYWIFRLICLVPTETVTSEHLEWLHLLVDALLKEKPTIYSMPADELSNIEDAFPGTIAELAKLLVTSPDSSPSFVAAFFASAFSEQPFNPETTLKLFANDMSLVKAAYMKTILIDSLADYEGATLRWLLQSGTLRLDELFDYLSHENAQPDLGSDNMHVALSSIWELPTCNAHATTAMDWLCQKGYISRYSPFSSLFAPDDKTARANCKKWALGYIAENSMDNEKMEQFFGIMAEASDYERIEYLAEFVKQNGSLEAFKNLPLHSFSMSGNPSFVPAHETRMQFLKDLESEIRSINTLDHCAYLERLIQNEARMIEHERLRDFLDHM